MIYALVEVVRNINIVVENRIYQFLVIGEEGNVVSIQL